MRSDVRGPGCSWNHAVGIPHEETNHCKFRTARSLSTLHSRLVASLHLIPLAKFPFSLGFSLLTV